MGFFEWYLFFVEQIKVDLDFFGRYRGKREEGVFKYDFFKEDRFQYIFCFEGVRISFFRGQKLLDLGLEVKRNQSEDQECYEGKILVLNF